MVYVLEMVIFHGYVSHNQMVKVIDLQEPIWPNEIVNLQYHPAKNMLCSTDWFKGKFTGKPHIWWENLWFPVDFPLNQSIDLCLQVGKKIGSAHD